MRERVECGTWIGCVSVLALSLLIWLVAIAAIIAIFN